MAADRGRSRTLQIDPTSGENELRVNYEGKWPSLPEVLKVSASPRQNSSPVRVLMFLMAVSRRSLNKPLRQSAATSWAFKVSGRQRHWASAFTPASKAGCSPVRANLDRGTEGPAHPVKRS
jgi:hypothetical protein